MQFGHALNGVSGMPVPGMSQVLNPVEEMDHRFVDILVLCLCIPRIVTGTTLLCRKIMFKEFVLLSYKTFLWQ